MGSSREENFCLRWNDFESNLSTAFAELRNDADLCDVTLATDEDSVGAHKLVLSACSPQLKEMIRKHLRLSGGNASSQNMMIYLRGVRHADLVSVLEFMYCGSVNVAQEDLNSFLAVAEDLKVKGLTQNSNNKELSGSKNRSGAAKRSVTPSGGGGAASGGGGGTPAAKKFRPSSSSNSQSTPAPSASASASESKVGVKQEPGKEDDMDDMDGNNAADDTYGGDDSHQGGGDDTFGGYDDGGAADDMGFEGDEGGAGPSEIGKVQHFLNSSVARLPKSFVWNYCTKETTLSATCNICGRKFATKGGNTSGLKKHLKKAHDTDC